MSMIGKDASFTKGTRYCLVGQISSLCLSLNVTNVSKSSKHKILLAIRSKKIKIAHNKDQTNDQNKHTVEFEILWHNCDWFLTLNDFK